MRTLHRMVLVVAALIATVLLVPYVIITLFGSNEVLAPYLNALAAVPLTVGACALVAVIALRYSVGKRGVLGALQAQASERKAHEVEREKLERAHQRALKQERERHSSELSAQLKRVEKLAVDLAETKEQRRGLQAQVGRASAQASEHERAESERANERQRWEQQRSVLIEQRKDAQAESANLREQIDELQRLLQQATELEQELREQLSALTAEQAQLLQTAADREAEFVEERANANQQLATEREASAVSQREAVRREAELTRKLVQNETALAELRNAAAARDSELQALMQQLAELRAEQVGLMRTHQLKLHALQVAQRELGDVRAELEASSSQSRLTESVEAALASRDVEQLSAFLEQNAESPKAQTALFVLQGSARLVSDCYEWLFSGLSALDEENEDAEEALTSLTAALDSLVLFVTSAFERFSAHSWLLAMSKKLQVEVLERTEPEFKLCAQQVALFASAASSSTAVFEIESWSVVRDTLPPELLAALVTRFENARELDASVRRHFINRVLFDSNAMMSAVKDLVSKHGPFGGGRTRAGRKDPHEWSVVRKKVRENRYSRARKAADVFLALRPQQVRRVFRAAIGCHQGQEHVETDRGLWNSINYDPTFVLAFIDVSKQNWLKWADRTDPYLFYALARMRHPRFGPHTHASIICDPYVNLLLEWAHQLGGKDAAKNALRIAGDVCTSVQNVVAQHQAGFDEAA